MNSPPGRRRLPITFRLAWTALVGILLLLVGGVGLAGALLGYRPLLAERYGFAGLALSLLLDVVFLLGGLVLLRWGWRTRRSDRFLLRRFLHWLDEHSRRIAARSAWRDYPKSKARLVAGGLSTLAAVISWGTLTLLTSDPVKGLALGAPWWLAFSAFFWGLTIDPGKAYKWTVRSIPFVLIVFAALAVAVGA